jgi:hypothetical protein
MRVASIFLFSLFLLAGFDSAHDDAIDFACMKAHKASNTCHFNFKVNGEKFRYVDVGCKYSKKKDEVILKAKEGSLALAKDWKIECPEPKPEETPKKPDGF